MGAPVWLTNRFCLRPATMATTTTVAAATTAGNMPNVKVGKEDLSGVPPNKTKRTHTHAMQRKMEYAVGGGRRTTTTKAIFCYTSKRGHISAIYGHHICYIRPACLSILYCTLRRFIFVAHYCLLYYNTMPYTVPPPVRVLPHTSDVYFIRLGGKKDFIFSEVI